MNESSEPCVYETNELRLFSIVLFALYIVQLLRWWLSGKMNLIKNNSIAEDICGRFGWQRNKVMNDWKFVISPYILVTTYVAHLRHHRHRMRQQSKQETRTEEEKTNTNKSNITANGWQMSHPIGDVRSLPLCESECVFKRWELLLLLTGLAVDCSWHGDRTNRIAFFSLSLLYFVIWYFHRK